MTYTHGGRPGEGAEYLRRSISRSTPGESHLRKAYALLIAAEMKQGRHDRALAACLEGREQLPDDVELRFRQGVLLDTLGRFAEARDAYLGVLSGHEERHLSSVDRGLTGFMARQNLAVVATKMGDLAEAERQWREVVREAPRYRQGWRGLGETIIQEQKLAEAETLAAELMKDEALRAEGMLLEGRVSMAQDRLDDARAVLELARAEFPGDLETLRERCQFLFHHGTAQEAEQALRALIARDATCADAHHNLGTLLMRCQRHDEAVVAYRQALRYRPNYVPTYQYLAHVLKESGRLAEAAAVWEQATAAGRASETGASRR